MFVLPTLPLVPAPKLSRMKGRLLSHGFFPETLPPCFSSEDCERALKGLSSLLSDRRFQRKRNAQPIPYSGTKHDGSRRLYASPHFVPYSDICDFIDSNWKTFQRQFKYSRYSIGTPRAATDDTARSIVVTPLSEVSTLAGQKIRYSRFILRADIAQFYPSLYTHVISWAAHGKEQAKADRKLDSRKSRFNKLDALVQNAQRGQTRGLLIGPDAYRIIAEFVAVQIDQELQKRANKLIVGAARHVDDFYIGVQSEADALTVLSHLRDSLSEFELNLNDLKTRIISGVAPLDDQWASRLRLMSVVLENDKSDERVANFLQEALDLSHTLGTQSPIKLAIRRADRYGLYRSPHFDKIEALFQRMAHHFPHAVDYICLLVVKRFALGESIDQEGWSDVVNAEIVRYLILGHHHEACWLFWLAVVCGFNISSEIVAKISKSNNDHLLALTIQAYVDGKCAKPDISFRNKLPSDDRRWLVNVVARSSEFTKAPFGGCYAEECEHVSGRHIRFVDYKPHLLKAASANVRAISNVRFGYEDEEDESESNDEDWGDVP